MPLWISGLHTSGWKNSSGWKVRGFHLISKSIRTRVFHPYREFDRWEAFWGLWYAVFIFVVFVNHVSYRQKVTKTPCRGRGSSDHVRACFWGEKDRKYGIYVYTVIFDFSIVLKWWFFSSLSCYVCLPVYAS